MQIVLLQQNIIKMSLNDKIKKHDGNWTRDEAIANPNILYVFTDNTDRDSGKGVISNDSCLSYSKKQMLHSILCQKAATRHYECISQHYAVLSVSRFALSSSALA